MSLYTQGLLGLAFFRARYTVAVFTGPDNLHIQGIILHATQKFGQSLIWQAYGRR
jgi:hypothetical protein